MAASGWVAPKRSCIQHGHDRISKLPDDILSQIVSLAPTIKDAVKTSVLSKRWKSVWTSVHVVRVQERIMSTNLASHPVWFQEQKAARFGNFIERVLNHPLLSLRILELSCNNVYIKQFTDIVTNKLYNHAASLHELDLTLVPPLLIVDAPTKPIKLPPSIFTSKKLVVLKLSFKVEQLAVKPLSSSSSSIASTVLYLPCLKVFHLKIRKDNALIDVPSVQNFLTGCPVLEELALSGRMHAKNNMKLRVKSSSLKRLKLSFSFNSTIEIDASNLEELHLSFNMGHYFFNMRDDQDEIVIVNDSLPLLMRVTLAITTRRILNREIPAAFGNRLFGLLRKAANTKYLFLSSDVMACLENGVFYQQLLPMFNNLMDLKLDISFSASCHILPWFLKSSPNLVSFFVRSVNPWKASTYQQQYRRTPNCTMMIRLHHLDKVELQNFEGSDHEMNLVRYLLMKSPALKEMICSFHAQMKEVASGLLSRIVQLPKASTACKVTTSLLDDFENSSASFAD